MSTLNINSQCIEDLIFLYNNSIQKELVQLMNGWVLKENADKIEKTIIGWKHCLHHHHAKGWAGLSRH